MEPPRMEQMKLIFVLALLFVAASASWVNDLSASEKRNLLGAQIAYVDLPKRSGASNSPMPTEFDSRTKWPGLVTPVRNQARCGSCWAFSATGALSDRFAIHSNGAQKPILSPQDPVSCDTSDYGCNGGYLDNVWNYFVQSGVVLDSCYPYVSGNGYVPSCASNCPSGQTWKKYYAKDPVDVSANEQAIMEEIYNNGPVQAAFSVYQDFFDYVPGTVYQHKYGGLDGGHAVVIVGWKVVEGKKAWIVRNSWDTTWGISGYWYHLKGVNECGIESMVVAGLPKL
ncbi:hypothetical protein PCE1_000699 [Barthelona sp. PCE]